MDPDANLQEQERICTVLPIRSRTVEQKRRLRELREALNVWIARGGFEPRWVSAPLASRYYGK